jgi:4,5-DOPA dioxygenase extradiol
LRFRHLRLQRHDPVALLSLQDGASPEQHCALGKILSHLRDQGVLILGSGSLTHNFTEIMLNAPAGAPAPWARQFVSWINERITEAILPRF